MDAQYGAVMPWPFGLGIIVSRKFVFVILCCGYEYIVLLFAFHSIKIVQPSSCLLKLQYLPIILVDMETVIHCTVESDSVPFPHPTEQQYVGYPIRIIPNPPVAREVPPKLCSLDTSIAPDAQCGIRFMDFLEESLIAEHINRRLTVQQASKIQLVRIPPLEYAFDAQIGLLTSL